MVHGWLWKMFYLGQMKMKTKMKNVKLFFSLLIKQQEVFDHVMH